MATFFGQVARVVGIILVTLQLVVIVYLAITINKSPLPEREQEKSNFTGLPVWRIAPCPHALSASKETVSKYVSAFVTGITSLYCIYIKTKGNFKRQRSAIPNETVTSDETVNSAIPNETINPVFSTFAGTSKSIDAEFITGTGTGAREASSIQWTEILFNSIITAYITATFLALVAGIILGVGRQWAIVGIFHNIMEVFILAALCHRSTANYVNGILTTVSEERQPLLVPIRNLKKLKDLYFLTFAALAHLIGNISNVVGNDSESSEIVFQMSYLVAFPIYTIYVRNSQKSGEQYQSARITVLDFILLFLWSATASAVVTLIGINRLSCK
ncbi:5342_t:CDS:2 [Ambispora leptoticha]|uniref:5342_t:CDS:1 n=1 Tax=Ambispora leptoticha TaxID=144679 RepID=A0A9N9D1N8_9GLOM|nr:5342_t:CDS:2 [Ambispora leptoticha]